MPTADDCARILEQERRLRLGAFDLATAWELGTRLREVALERDAGLVIEVRLARQTVFHCMMPGATPLNADWARRKGNTVELTQRSSYGIGLEGIAEGMTLIERAGLPERDYAVAGGGFPIRLDDGSCVGAVIVSGLPQREDHALIVEVLAEFCGLPLEGLALPD